MDNSKIYFQDRDDAAKQLLHVLPIEEMKLEEWMVFSTSSNGFKIAKIVAKELNSEVDYIFSDKIYAPNNEECEIAIVTESQEVVIHEELVKAFDISLDFIFDRSKLLHGFLLNYQVANFRGSKPLECLKNKNILLVDEGLNTSLTMMACIKTAINLGAKSVSVAVPIIPDASIPVIESIADDLYFVKNIDHFIDINYYYKELEEIKFKDIINMKEEG